MFTISLPWACDQAIEIAVLKYVFWVEKLGGLHCFSQRPRLGLCMANLSTLEKDFCCAYSKLFHKDHILWGKVSRDNPRLQRVTYRNSIFFKMSIYTEFTYSRLLLKHPGWCWARYHLYWAGSRLWWVDILSCGPTYLCSPTSYIHLRTSNGMPRQTRWKRNCQRLEIGYVQSRQKESQPGSILYLTTTTPLPEKMRICHQVLGERVVRWNLLFCF